MRATGNPACHRQQQRRRSGARRANQARARRGRQAAGRSRPDARAGAPHRLRRRRVLFVVLGLLAALRSAHFADPADARQSRQPDQRTRAAEERQRQPGRAAQRADQPIGAKQLRLAIHHGRPQFRTARLLRGAAGRRHGRQSERQRRPRRHLSHRMCAHLRRLLFPGLLFHRAEPVRRRRQHLPAPVPGFAGFALHVSQSRRRDRTGCFDRRRPIHRAAERLPLPQRNSGGLHLPRGWRELGSSAAQRRRQHHAGKRRHRCNRQERQAALAEFRRAANRPSAAPRRRPPQPRRRRRPTAPPIRSSSIPRTGKSASSGRRLFHSTRQSAASARPAPRG